MGPISGQHRQHPGLQQGGFTAGGRSGGKHDLVVLPEFSQRGGLNLTPEKTIVVGLEKRALAGIGTVRSPRSSANPLHSSPIRHCSSYATCLAVGRSVGDRFLDASRKAVAWTLRAGRENPPQRSGQSRLVKRLAQAQSANVKQ